jgi:hypothetical protein
MLQSAPTQALVVSEQGRGKIRRFRVNFQVGSPNEEGAKEGRERF